MSFPRYPRYKDSGVEWLGEVPEHWELARTKRLFELMKRAPLEEDGIVTAFRDGEVTLRTNRRVEGFTNAVHEHGYQRVLAGDLVIHAMDAFAGAIGVSDSIGKSTPVYAVCQPRAPSVDARYYARLLRHMALSGYITSLAKGVRERSTEFRWSEAGDLVLVVPPASEQVEISTFIDRETAKVDALIAEQQRLIQLLREKRQSIISQAVTKGLDPGAPMKHSDVEWLGDIPMHWEVLSLRRLSVAVQTGRTPSDNAPAEDVESGIMWFTPGDFSEQLWLLNSARKVSLDAEDSGELILFPPGCILIVSIGATLGKIGIATEWSSANQQINAVIPNERVEACFLGYSLSVKADVMRYLSNASTIGIMNQEKTKAIPIAVPPLTEQGVITKVIDRATGEIDALTTEAERAISLLQERRTALISAAVTGKIDVRGLAEAA